MDATPLFTEFYSVLVVTYAICGWTFAATMGLSDVGWVEAGFDAELFMGPLYGHSTVAFLPQTASFSYWEGSLRLTIAGVSTHALMRLEGDGVGWLVGMSSEAGECDLSALARFNLTEEGVVQTPACTTCFSGAWLEAAVSLGCLAPIRATLAFTQFGFDGFALGVEDVPLAGIAWLLFDLELLFDDGVHGKSLSVTPHLRLGDDLCFILYTDLLGTDTLIEGVKLYGLELYYAWDGVYVSNLTVFDTSDPYGLVEDPYWEVLCVGSVNDSCGGGEYTFTACTFFDASSTRLFDWGMTTIEAAVGVGSHVLLSGLVRITASGIEEACFGLGISW